MNSAFLTMCTSILNHSFPFRNFSWK